MADAKMAAIACGFFRFAPAACRRLLHTGGVNRKPPSPLLRTAKQASYKSPRSGRAMQDFFRWSLLLGRFFGIPVRVHWLFPFVAAGLILQAALQKDVIPGTWIDAMMLEALLFGVILLHEFGHCFGARAVDGDAQEVLMWPLGGLAFVDVPHTPRANFIATAAGPAVNVVICMISGLLFSWVTHFEYRLPWNPIPG